MKRILTLLLAVLMLLGLSTSAMAALTGPSQELIYSTIYGNLGFYPILRPILPSVPSDPDADVDASMGIPNLSNGSVFLGSTACPSCIKTALLYYVPGEGTYLYCTVHGWTHISSVVNPQDPNAVYYTVTATSNIGGTVILNNAPAKSVSVKKGDPLTVSIVPHFGYEVACVYVNGYALGAVDTLPIPAVYRNYYIRVVFKAIDIHKYHNINLAAAGQGSITASVNDISVGEASSLKVNYADKVALQFNPINAHYKVEKVVVNGKNLGAIPSLELYRLNTDLDISVSFVWDNPYSDVDEKYLAAVEYVTEIDVMGSPNLYVHTDLFLGEDIINVRAMAIYLAELADVDDKLNTVSQRVTWARENGLFLKDENIYEYATVTRACDMLKTYLRLLESKNGMTFTALTKTESAYDIAAAMKLVNAASYKENAEVTRYYMAQICYAISLLEVK